MAPAAAGAPKEMTMTLKVVAAVIRRRGSILICRRPQGKDLAGLWEFPGGKVRCGEHAAAALVRECREELGVQVVPAGELLRSRHDYGSYSVDITFFDCALPVGEPLGREGQHIEWVTAAELKNYAFCPADGGVVELLSGGTA